MSDDNFDVRVPVFMTNGQLSLVFLGLMTLAETAKRNGAKAKVISAHECMAAISAQVHRSP